MSKDLGVLCDFEAQENEPQSWYVYDFDAESIVNNQWFDTEQEAIKYMENQNDRL